MKAFSVVVVVLVSISVRVWAGEILGEDDFEIGSMDASKWMVVLDDAGTSLSETNGRLEFISLTPAPYADRSQAREWIGGGLSYTQDWSITFQAVNQLDAGAIVSNENWFGVLITDDSSTLSHVFSLDIGKENYGFAAYDVGSVLELNDVALEDALKSVSNPELKCRIFFDSATKTLKSFYNEGGGFIPLLSVNAGDWGMSADDLFSVVPNGGNSGMAISSGMVYMDDFVIRNETISVPDLSISSVQSQMQVEFRADAGLYYEVWGSTNLIGPNWEGPVGTTSGIHTAVQVAVLPLYTAQHFQVRGFESAPDAAAFQAQVVGTTLPGTLTFIDSATRFTYDNSESGNWSFEKTHRDSARLTFTYDSEENDPSAYREEILLLYSGKDVGTYRFSEFYFDEEDPASIGTGLFELN